ncbi:MAG: hypothetical protein ACI4D7_03020 [Lachnospiraceae bacterium]
MNRMKMCITNVLLMTDFIVLALSGFAIHFLGGKVWAITHSITAILCIVLVAFHIVQHAQMMKAVKKPVKKQA